MHPSGLPSFLKETHLRDRPVQTACLHLDLYLSYKSSLIWNNFSNSPHDPRVMGCRVVHNEYNVSRNEVALDSGPLLTILKLRQYSFVHLFQNKFDMYCTCFHLRTAYKSSFWKRPGGNDGWALRSKRWLGVRASKWLGFVEDFVSGLLLRIALTSQRTVWRPSSSRVCTLKVELRTFLMERISLSQAPPWWDPVGGLKVHLIPLCRSSSWIWEWFHCSIDLLNSRSAQTKLVPLSEQSSLTCPHLARKRCKALMELVSNDAATSICTALRAKHVNITPYLFTWLLPRFTSNGPKHSTPTVVVSKWWIIWRYSAEWQICHLLAAWNSLYPSTYNAFCQAFL